MFGEQVPGYGIHVWHFCKSGEHEKCSGFGSLVQRKGKKGRTWIIDGTRGHGHETVYCECYCHAEKRGDQNGR